MEDLSLLNPGIWESGIARLMEKNWHVYSPPGVINWFSPKTLILQFNYYGFEEIDSGRPSKKMSVRHALSFLDAKILGFIFKKIIQDVNLCI